MQDELIKQRIKFLVEHGGIWDDPRPHDLAKMMLTQRWLMGAVFLALTVNTVVILLT